MLITAYKRHAALKICKVFKAVVRFITRFLWGGGRGGGYISGVERIFARRTTLAFFVCGVRRGAGNKYKSDRWKWREVYCIRFSVMHTAIFHIALFTYSETNLEGEGVGGGLRKKGGKLGSKDETRITPVRVRQQPEPPRK